MLTIMHYMNKTVWGDRLTGWRGFYLFSLQRRNAQRYRMSRRTNMHMQIFFKTLQSRLRRLQRARQIRHLLSTKFVLNAFSCQIFFFSCYQNILLCKAHHRKFISPAQLQHNASHHGWLGENAGWVGSVFRICNWSISPGFLITHCGRIPLYPLYGGTKILHCSIHKVNGKNQQKTWLHQCLLSFLQETDWWLY